MEKNWNTILNQIFVGEILNSFIGETLVMTDNGDQAIENINIGTNVLIKNENTGNTEYKKVTAIFKSNNKHIMILKYGSGKELVSTINHHYWVPNKGWTPANQVLPGDQISTLNGLIQIDSTTKFYNEEVIVYDIRLSDSIINYFVTEDHIWARSSYFKKPDSYLLINDLNSFSGINYSFGNKTFLLDKKGLKHILERHHPKFFSGELKNKTSFFDKDLNIDELLIILDDILKQNRNKLIEKGSGGMYQINGTVQGKDYIVGMNNGRIGQFYPL